MKRSERVFGFAAVLVTVASLASWLTWKSYQSGRLLLEKGDGRWLLLMHEVPSTPSLADLITRQGNYVYACEIKAVGIGATACTFNLGGSYRLQTKPDANVIKGRDGEDEIRFKFGNGRVVKCRYSIQAGAEWRFE